MKLAFILATIASAVVASPVEIVKRQSVDIIVNGSIGTQSGIQLKGTSNVTNHGGWFLKAAKLHSTLTKPLMYQIYIGPNWSVSDIDLYQNFFNKIGKSKYLSDTLADFGILAPSSVNYFNNASIGNANTAADVKTLINNKYSTLTGSTTKKRGHIFNIMLDSTETANVSGCGYHSFYGSGTGIVAYAVNGYGKSGCVWSGGDGFKSSAGTIYAPWNGLNGKYDAQFGTAAHEILESLTDTWWSATSGGWWSSDSDYSENGDKCNRLAGKMTIANGKVYNLKLGTKKYLVQMAFNKSGNNCRTGTWVD
jgi:hypothetical protein